MIQRSSIKHLVSSIQYQASSIRFLSHCRGFTLVEILVALGLTAIIAATFFKILSSQQLIYISQDQAVELQQGLRAAIDMMVKELRQAGYDPSGRASAGMVHADETSLHFTMDLNGNGNCSDGNEDITYSLYRDTKYGWTNLGRKSGAGSNQSIAMNVEKLEFWYTVDKKGIRTATHNPQDGGKVTGIEINLLLKAQKSDKGFTDTSLYHTTHSEAGATDPPADWGPYNDGFRRRFASTVVKCRNIEFK
jgi:type IV pilus assembly protein PilW